MKASKKNINNIKYNSVNINNNDSKEVILFYYKQKRILTQKNNNQNKGQLNNKVMREKNWKIVIYVKLS